MKRKQISPLYSFIANRKLWNALIHILLFSSVSFGEVEKNLPNIIIIITDDQGYGDYSAHGNPVLKTPAMDALYNESVRLTDFHVAPMCTPTRGQLLTGLDAMRNGAVAVCQGRSMMRNGIPTIANYFSQSGYSTGHFGKWHLGDSYPHRPQDRGFDETLNHPAWGITSLADHFGNSYFNPYLNRNGKKEKYTGYCTDIFFAEAMKWMKNQHDQNNPFFLYLATNTPHVPNWVDEQYSAPYKKIGSYNGVEIPANFYGMIANIDENLVGLDRFLNAEGLKENTIFIYMNDNGTQSRIAEKIFNAGMRGRKTEMYEGGHRVACFIRWPGGRLRHGEDIDALTQVQDIFPTLVELAGVPTKKIKLDGISLAGLIGLEAQPSIADRKLVIQYSFGETSGTPWNRAIVLWDKWRLVGPHQLFDLRKDPHQNRNIIHEYPDIATSMRNHYVRWYDNVRTDFEKERYIHIGNANNNSVTLFASDWVGGYCDNTSGLINADASGYWNVIVEQDGKYEIELRRWPKETVLALIAGTKREGNRQLEERFTVDNLGARPIHSATLKIGNVDETVVINPNQKSVSFTVDLTVGKERLETIFSDRSGIPLCSAMYVNVRSL